MAKSKKIEVKNVVLRENQEGTLKIKGFENEEIPFENLTSEIRDFIKLGNPVNIKISKARKGGSGGRKPTYKYQCTSCAKEIKSTVENLVVKCVDCDCEFISVD